VRQRLLAGLVVAMVAVAFVSRVGGSFAAPAGTTPRAVLPMLAADFGDDSDTSQK